MNKKLKYMLYVGLVLLTLTACGNKNQNDANAVDTSEKKEIMPVDPYRDVQLARKTSVHYRSDVYAIPDVFSDYDCVVYDDNNNIIEELNGLKYKYIYKDNILTGVIAGKSGNIEPVEEGKYEYVVDENNVIIEKKIYNDEGEIYESIKYNEDHYVVEDIIYSHVDINNTGDYEAMVFKKKEYVYDGPIVIEYTYEEYDRNNGKRAIVSKNTFDQLGRRTSAYQSDVDIIGDLDFTVEYNDTYDDSGHLICSDGIRSDSSSKMGLYKYHYDFDENGRMIDQVTVSHEYKDKTGDEYNASDKTVIIYDWVEKGKQADDMTIPDAEEVEQLIPENTKHMK